MELSEHSWAADSTYFYTELLEATTMHIDAISYQNIIKAMLTAIYFSCISNISAGKFANKKKVI